MERNLAYVLAEKKAGKVKTSLIGYISVAIEGDIANGWTDEQEKAIDTKRKIEAEERKKEREADEKSKREREEMNSIFKVFQGQSESMQDVILDMVESDVEATVQVPAFINEIKTLRKKGEIKLFQARTKNKFKEAMQENGLI